MEVCAPLCSPPLLVAGYAGCCCAQTWDLGARRHVAAFAALLLALMLVSQLLLPLPTVVLS